jgi:hypothetical protein
MFIYFLNLTCLPKEQFDLMFKHVFPIPVFGSGSNKKKIHDLMLVPCPIYKKKVLASIQITKPDPETPS